MSENDVITEGSVRVWVAPGRACQRCRKVFRAPAMTVSTSYGGVVCYNCNDVCNECYPRPERLEYVVWRMLHELSKPLLWYWEELDDWVRSSHFKEKK